VWPPKKAIYDDLTENMLDTARRQEALSNPPGIPTLRRFRKKELTKKK
jgi:hypothetical protein